MSIENFDAKAKKHGYVRARRATDNKATLGGCYKGNHKQETLAQPLLETVYKDSNENFEF